MFKLAAAITALIFPFHTQVLSIEQASGLLEVSVLIHAKQYQINPETKEVRKGVIGCSGTYIGEGTILTAAHCFAAPTAPIWVKGYREPVLTARIAKLDFKHDLALLAVVHKKGHKYAKIAQSVRLGEFVVNVGSPFSLQFLLSEGIVAALGVKEREFDSTYTITTAMINPGSSGGGAFNERGELLGVNTMSMGGPFGWAGISMAVDAKTIKEFLK